jgi:hypothetical protein
MAVWAAASHTRIALLVLRRTARIQMQMNKMAKMRTKRETMQVSGITSTTQMIADTAGTTMYRTWHLE